MFKVIADVMLQILAPVFILQKLIKHF